MDFNDRKKRINEFLSFLSQIAKENPQFDFRSDAANRFIYNQLIKLGVSDDDKKINLSDNPSPNYHGLAFNNDNTHPESTFSTWINYFRDRDTKVFVSNKWKYFCQFISKDNTAQNQKEHMKIYVPLDASHIEIGARMIFDFLDINNISHISEVGKEIRFDDIVIRLSNTTDAEFLLNYLRSNQYIQNGLIKANPFAYNKDGIAVAVDGSLSYNNTIAGLLSLYIDDRKRYNLLSNIDYEDFYRFFDDLLRKQFVTRENNDILTYFNIQSDKELNNYKEVFSLIRKVNNPEFSFNDIKLHFENCLNVKTKLSQNKIDRVNKDLFEAIDVMIKKYGVTPGIRNVEHFYLTGEPRCVTRTNNIRNRLVYSDFRKDLAEILKSQNKSFINYVYEIMDKNGYNLQEVVVRK